MNSTQRHHRGFSSVLALIYLVLLAALALGFYTAIDLSGNMADNEQNINRSSLEAESALAYGRYAISKIDLPCSTTQSQLLSGVLANLPSGVTQYAGSNIMAFSPLGTGYTTYIVRPPVPPALMPTGTQTTCAITGLTSPTTQPVGNATTQPCVVVPGWTTNNNVSSPNWMPIDSSGGLGYLVITQAPNTMNISVMAVGTNSNARVTSVSRAIQLGFDSPANANVFAFGIFSYGMINLNSSVNVTGQYNGSNISVFAVTYQTSAGPPATYSKPINVNSNDSIAGDFYYTNSPSGINWGTLKVDGYLPTSGQFSNHVHADTPAPPAMPTINTSSFTSYVSPSALSPGGNSTAAVTNASLSTPGTYTFNHAVTINGILYVNSGVNLVFNQGVTVDGAIVAATGTTGGSVTFNSTLTQNSYSIGTAAEQRLLNGDVTNGTSGMFMFLPNYNVTFNGTTTINNGSIIAGTNFPANGSPTNTITFNATSTIKNGEIVNLGDNNLTFNAGAGMSITPSGTASSGVNLNDVAFTPAPSSYTEVP